MPGSHTISDADVVAAVQGDGEARNRLLAVLGMQVRAMVVVRLAPEPSQWHAVEDLAQQSLIDLLEGLQRLETPAAACLRAFMSTIVERRVVEYIRDVGPNRQIAPASLDA